MLTLSLLLTANALLINSRPMDPFNGPESNTLTDFDKLDGLGLNLPPEYELEEFGREHAYPGADFFNFDDLKLLDHERSYRNIGGNNPVLHAPWQFAEREYPTYQPLDFLPERKDEEDESMGLKWGTKKRRTRRTPKVPEKDDFLRREESPGQSAETHESRFTGTRFKTSTEVPYNPRSLKRKSPETSSPSNLEHFGRNLKATGSLKTPISDPDNERQIFDKHKNPKFLSEISNQRGVYFDVKKGQWVACLRHPGRKRTFRNFSVSKHTFEGAKKKAEKASREFYGVTGAKGCRAVYGTIPMIH